MCFSSVFAKRIVLCSLLSCTLVGGQCLSADGLSAGAASQQTAAEIDRLLIEFFAQEDVQVAPIARDEDFLRRVSLDLNGVVPSPKDVTVFGLNPDPAKRQQLIDRLLDRAEFGRYWGAYWREVVMSRATEQRARIVVPAFQEWLTQQLNDNQPWDEITRELIVATGPVGETGETGLIFAHTGQPEELAAEISRIFLGIQMSCANCHDHPTDSWKREDFHQLAAFLPRVSVRREEPGNPRSFAVRSFDSDPRRRRNANVDVDQLFRFLDRNRNGQLAKSEARGQLAERFDQILAVADADKNKQLSKAEFSQARLMNNNNQPGQGEMEYYMPDLNNPAAQGTLTQPVFFLPEAKGPQLDSGADDLTRRHALADFITSPTNPWFARAFVNRIWFEMLGQGFYMPIDDMGPERIAMCEDVLDVLAQGFVKSGYDVKWVYRTIASTQAYQRQIRKKDAQAYEPPFAAASPTRLSSDQIYNSLFEVLGVPDGGFAGRGMRSGMMARRGGADFARLAFQQTFGEDPSTPKDEIIGNVPQALFLMNSPQVELAVSARGNSRLARILREQDRDDDALSELYLLVLSREPTDRELAINQAYISDIGERNTAFEDIMWALLNSTEFLSKR